MFCHLRKELASPSSGLVPQPFKAAAKASVATTQGSPFATTTRSSISMPSTLLGFSMAPTHRSRFLPQGAASSTSFSASPSPPVYRGGNPRSLATCAMNQAAMSRPPMLRSNFPSSFLGFREKPVYRSLPASSFAPGLRRLRRPSGKQGLVDELAPRLSRLQGAVARLAPACLPPHPYTVAKYSHFRCAVHPRVAVDALAASLRTCGADFVLKESKCKFKGTVTCKESYRRIEFVVRVWSSTSASASDQEQPCLGLVVEFTRRSGDAFEWQDFFSRVRQEVALESGGVWGAKVGQSKASPFSGNSTHAVMAGADASCAEHLAPLVTMLSSTYAAVQFEGIRQLASLSRSADQAGALCKGGLVGDLHALLRSPHAGVQRCATAAAANLFKAASASASASSFQLQPEFSDQVGPAVDAISALLASPPSLDGELGGRQTRRFAVDALASLCANSAFSSLVSQHGGADALERSVSDTRLGARTLHAAQEALSTLRSNATSTLSF